MLIRFNYKKLTLWPLHRDSVLRRVLVPFEPQSVRLFARLPLRANVRIMVAHL